MYMDDNISPGGTESEFRKVPSQGGEGGYRPNYPSGNMGPLNSQAYASGLPISDETGSFGGRAMDLRFAPMGQDMMYRRDDIFTAENSIYQQDSNFRPTGVINPAVNIIVPDRTETNYNHNSSVRNNSDFTTSCRFSEKHNMENAEKAMASSHTGTHLVKSNSEHARHDNADVTNVAVSRETVPIAAPEGIETVNMRGSKTDSTGMRSQKSEAREKDKHSKESSTNNNKVIKSEYFKTGEPEKDSNKSESDFLPIVPEFDIVKNETSDTTTKLKISLKRKRNTSHKKESSVTLESKDQENPDGSHNKEKAVYACESCEKKYGRKDHLMRHVQSAHSDIRPYVCRVCLLAFSRKDRLTRHEQKHSGCPKYPCLICKKKFFRKDGLAKHLITGCGCKQKDKRIFCKCQSSDKSKVENVQ